MRDLYNSDGADFRCDTSQVGCAQICFNYYNPISVQRFRNIEIILITVPWLLFYGYAMSINNKLNKFKDHRKKLVFYQKVKQDREKRKRSRRNYNLLKNSFAFVKQNSNTSNQAQRNNLPSADGNIGNIPSPVVWKDVGFVKFIKINKIDYF